MLELTQTVKKGGCAAKLPAGTLRSVLSSLQLKGARQLVVGIENFDDASLWDLGDGRLLVQTLDFFTPIVDDPFDFGAIAAANALSDVYAMGGAPATAQSILAFPTAHLPLEVLNPLLRGAVEKIEESGAVLSGGHSIDDETLKLGFAVTGFVNKSSAWTNAQAQVGDQLILTKGLGTGTITSALKSREANPEWVKSAIQSMTQLNRVPEMIDTKKVHAATDITGFGLAGHAMQMALASQVTFVMDVDSLPMIPGAVESIAAENLNRAHQTNLDYVKSKTLFGNISPHLKWLTVDPQTSGGLLLSVPQAEAKALCEILKKRFELVSIVGQVEARGEFSLHFI